MTLVGTCDGVLAAYWIAPLPCSDASSRRAAMTVICPDPVGSAPTSPATSC